MDFTPVNIRTWSILGPRGTFGTTLFDLAAKNNNIVALSADLCTTSGLDRFKTEFPDRFFNTGIAEPNMVGVAAGLASVGKIPFATTFANFCALRSCEQIRHFLGYMKENVKIVGIGAGFEMGMFGNTHYAVQDIAALYAIPNLVIISPADCTEVVKAVIEISKVDYPVYLRLTGTMNNPIIYKKDFDFKIGKANLLQSGTDIALVATGSMVFNAKKAAEVLEMQGIRCTIIDMHTIKPLDTEMIDSLLDQKLIVTVEEHSVLGGLGNAIAGYLSHKSRKPKHLILGVPDAFMHAGDYSFMIQQSGLSSSTISTKIMEAYGEMK